MSFFRTILSLLKGKIAEGHYNPISTEEEGRVHHVDAAEDDVNAGLLGNRRTPRNSCRLSWGISWMLFWKILGVLLALIVLWHAYKLLRWALYDPPPGLERMPEFSTSLGCLAAPYIYNLSSTTFHAPIGSQQEQAFDIRGDAVGTLTVLEGSPDFDGVRYEMLLQTNNNKVLGDVRIHYPQRNSDGETINSRLVIDTPGLGQSPSTCVRFDIKMYIPPQLRKLHIASHATMHLRFEPNALIELDDFYVTLFSMSTNNMILPSLRTRSRKLSLEVYRGWIVGDVAVEDTTTISTQRGDGVTSVRVHPTEPKDPKLPAPANFRTVTGAGRTNVFYVASKLSRRPIQNAHMSSRNGDMYLTYREAQFNGRIELSSKRYNVTGVEALPKSEGNDDGAKDSRWSHFRGNKDGGDEIVIKSRGWTGLYFSVA